MEMIEFIKIIKYKNNVINLINQKSAHLIHTLHEFIRLKPLRSNVWRNHSEAQSANNHVIKQVWQNSLNFKFDY